LTSLKKNSNLFIKFYSNR